MYLFLAYPPHIDHYRGYPLGFLPTKLSNSLVVLNFLSFNPYPHFYNSDGSVFWVPILSFPFLLFHIFFHSLHIPLYSKPTLNNTLPIKFPALIHQWSSLLTKTFIQWFSELPVPLSTFFISPLSTSTSSFTVYIIIPLISPSWLHKTPPIKFLALIHQLSSLFTNTVGYMHGTHNLLLLYGCVCFRHVIGQFSVRNLLYGPKFHFGALNLFTSEKRMK